MSNDTETAGSEKTQADEINQQAERAAVNMGNTPRASWNISADNLRKNISHMRPEAKELLMWSFNWCIDPQHPITLPEFAERVGYSKNTCYKIFTGKYVHAESGARLDINDRLLKELRQFRRMEVNREKLENLSRKPFVLTPTAKAIFMMCDLARESHTPVFIEGASHIGKTEAYRQYCAENNHGSSRLIELRSFGGLHDLVRYVASMIGVSPAGNASKVSKRIEEALAPDMVLIFDEMHILEMTTRKESYLACIEWIRRLYDKVQFGLVLSYTNIGFAKMERERKRELEQIFRRGVHRKNLGDRPSVKDVTALVEFFGLEFPARNDEVELKLTSGPIIERPHAVLAQLAAEQGLKSIIERIRYATKLGADGEKPVSWELFIRAHVMMARNAMPPDHGWN